MFVFVFFCDKSGVFFSDNLMLQPHCSPFQGKCCNLPCCKIANKNRGFKENAMCINGGKSIAMFEHKEVMQIYATKLYSD